MFLWQSFFKIYYLKLDHAISSKLKFLIFKNYLPFNIDQKIHFKVMYCLFRLWDLVKWWMFWLLKRSGSMWKSTAKMWPQRHVCWRPHWSGKYFKTLSNKCSRWAIRSISLILFNSYGHQAWDIFCIVGLGLTEVSKGLCNGNNGKAKLFTYKSCLQIIIRSR